jgi:nitrite reductase/ring-hydroxylating ferredoxin subunit
MKLTRRSAIGMALLSASASLFGTRAVASSKQIVKLSKVKVGGTYSFQLSNGAPAILFRTKTGVFAYQTICPHQGGLTQYLALKKLIVCPVHKASFDPFKAGKVVAGPSGQSANSISKLPSVKVTIKGSWIEFA